MQQVKPKKLALPKISVGNIALLLAGASMVGQVLGFLRTKLVNANFDSLGPHSTGSYFAAFNIPDFFFFTVAAGALGVAFMPVLAERLHRGDRKSVWELSTSLLNLLCILMFIVGIIIEIFARPLIHHIVAPKLTPSQLDDAVTIMRFVAFNPLFFTISGVLTSVQQTLGRFVFFAIAPLFYNLSIIASIYIFRHTEFGLKGLGVGAFIGGAAQLLVVVFGLRKMSFSWRPRIKTSKDFKTILRNLPPRSLDQGMDQIESIVETNFASHLGTQVITYYSNAYTLQTAPTLLIGTAISTAVFPRLSNRLAAGRTDLFRRDFLRALRGIIWLTLPVVVVCYFCRGYLARLIFAKDSQEIGIIFGYLTVAIFFRTVYSIISRWYYAQKDTRTPLFVSVFTIALNIVLAYTLSQRSSYGIAGLAMAQSIVAMVEVIILSIIMIVRDRGLLNMQFWGGCFRIVSVTGFSALACYIMVNIFPLGAADRGPVTMGAKLIAISGVVFTVYVGLSTLFTLEEVQPILSRLKRLFRPIRIQY
jgi:putative peptidoglycan lipid II flippase